MTLSPTLANSLSTGAFPQETTTNKPPLPSRDPQDRSSLSKLLVKRQLESYTLPIMNEMSDLFAVKSLSDNVIKQKIDKVLELNEGDDFWSEFIAVDENKLTAYGNNSELESELIKGIPPKYRGVVYMKVFHIKYQLSKEKYMNLLNKSVKTKSDNDDDIESVEDQKGKNALRVFNYYTNEILLGNNKMDIINNDDLLTNFYQSNELNIKFLVKIGDLLSRIPDVHEEEILYILLKFNKLLINLNKDQLLYEINRSIEDIVEEPFIHISKNGCDLKQIIRSEIFKNFMSIKDVDFMYHIIDFILFQGFAFLARLFVFVFKQSREEILLLEGDELNQFLLEGKAIDRLTVDDIQDIIKIEPDIIKYENEYYLVHINSLNNNNNELLNAQEVNRELNRKIEQLNLEIENIKTTHTDILVQSTEYEAKVKSAEDENEKLGQQYAKLKQQFDTLTMKDNLDNTIKANKEFSERNQELQDQIEAIKALIDTKLQKLNKYQG